jgi:hypothetical protein
MRHEEAPNSRMLGQIANFLILHAAIVAPLTLVVLMVLFESVRLGVAFCVRVIARLLLIAAMLALVYDGTRTLAAGSGIIVTPLLDHLQTLAPQMLAWLKATLARLHPLAWDAGALRIMRMPSWLVIGALGFLLAWAGRKRHRVNVFVN